MTPDEMRGLAERLEHYFSDPIVPICHNAARALREAADTIDRLLWIAHHPDTDDHQKVDHGQPE